MSMNIFQSFFKSKADSLQYQKTILVELIPLFPVSNFVWGDRSMFMIHDLLRLIFILSEIGLT